MNGTEDGLTSFVIRLYRDQRLSACLIAERIGRKTTTRATVEFRLARNGVGGVTWCPRHGTYEAISAAG
jgi:hypothetical protein